MADFSYHRRPTHQVNVGQTVIGGDNPVIIQTMTNTSTLDTEATVQQIARCVDVGASIVRMTAQGVSHARNLAAIRKQLDALGVKVDLVADIHFNPAAAYEAALHVEKVRINPGNFVDPGRVFKKIEYSDEEYASELLRLKNAFEPFLELCRKNGTAIRIGVNHGSLSDRIMSRYGDTPLGMVESAMEFLRIARENHFDNIVISIKASNVIVMTETVKLLAETMANEGMTYPLHLGVTEAGDGEDGRVKSAVGIGSLLLSGIGDTIRVSLSEAPEAEIPVAREILRQVETIADSHEIYSLTENDTPIDASLPKPYVLGLDTAVKAGKLYSFSFEPGISLDELIIAASIRIGWTLLNREVDGIEIIAPGFTSETINNLVLNILQATRKRITKTEYIACPGCGRTLFDLSTTLKSVREATSHLKGLKIGVMGCIVNGPGEMADADYGYVGGAKDKVSLYRGKECVMKNLPAEEAIAHLVDLIKNDGRWVDPGESNE